MNNTDNNLNNLENLNSFENENGEVEQNKKDAKNERLKIFKKDYNRSILNVLIFFAILQILCSSFMYIGFFILYMKEIMPIVLNAAEGVTPELPTFNMEALRSSDGFILVPILYIIGNILAILVTLLVNRKLIYKGKQVDINIKKLTAKEYLIYLCAGITLWGIGVVIGNLPTFLGVPVVNSVEAIFGEYMVLFTLIAIFAAPFIEEVVCRRMFIDRSSEHGETLVVVMSALCFGLMHGNTAQFFLAFGMGLILGIVYLKTRRLIYVIGMHFIVNFWASLTTIIKFFIGSSTEGQIKACEIVETVWIIITALAVVASAIVTILNRKSELFKLKKNNEFDAKLIKKVPGYSIFVIVTVVITLTNNLLTIGTSLLNGSFEAKSLLLFIPDVVFVVFFILFNKFIDKKMNGVEIEK